jgi:hypothetical protein
MFKHAFFYIFTFVLCSFLTSAQPHELQEVSQVTSFAMTKPGNPAEITGYIALYKRAKSMKENDVFGIDLMNLNLEKTNSAKILVPLGTTLITSVFNDSVVGLMFYNPDKKHFLLKSYDLALNERGSRTEKPKSEELSLLDMVHKQELPVPNYFFRIYPIPGGQGFVRAGFGETDEQYKITCYDNNFKNKWSRGTKEDDPYIEFFSILNVSKQYAAGMSIRRKSMLSPKMEHFLVVYDLEKGKKALDVPIERADSKLNFSAAFLDDKTQTVLLQGEYWGQREQPGLNKSNGLFLKKFDLATKKELSEKTIAWTGEMAARLNPSDAKLLTDPAYHTAIAGTPLANGNTLLALQQFKKTAEGVSPHLMVLGEKTPGLRIKTGHVLAVELNNRLGLVSVHMLDLAPLEYTLPPGTDIVGIPLLGHFSQNALYKNAPFLQYNAAGQCTGAVLSDPNAAQVDVHTISTDEQGSVRVSKSGVATANPRSTQLLPSVTGRAMMAEYRPDEQKCGFKIR